MNYTESTCTTDYSGIISLLEVQVSRFLHGVRHTPLSLLKACFQLPDTSLYSSIGIKNSIRPVWRKSLYPSMSIDILTVNRGIKNSCILSRRKSLMALYHGTQAIITFLLNNPLYSEFVECRYPSSVKISTCNFHSQCSLGAVSVQIGASCGTRELFSVNYVLHYSGTIRCKHGAVLVLTRCSWWNQRAIFSQLGPPLFPVFLGEVGEAGQAR